MNKKEFAIGLTLSLIILVSLMMPMVVSVAPGQHDDNWYMTVDGVLDTDYYALYPYNKKSLDIGFSQFGEMLGLPAGLDPDVPANWVGLTYDGRDPFAPPTPPPGIPPAQWMASWLNGWFIDIEYTDPSTLPADRHIWAMAMFGDGTNWGFDWQVTADPRLPPNGGRKTNAEAVTDPMKIIYNGPRRLVAQQKTHISDVQGMSKWPVVNVIITLIFNKVKKEVVLLKDVKLTIPKLHLEGKLDIEFSNREEWDLGDYPTYDSYAHFYEEELKTCFGPDWHMAKTLLRAVEDTFTGDGSSKTFKLSHVPVVDFIKVWVGDVFMRRVIDYDMEVVDGQWTGKITFVRAPPKDDLIEVHYKTVHKTPDIWNHTYDVAQIISSDQKYVGWHAFWPPVSDYTVDGIGLWWTPLLWVSTADMPTEPKFAPIVIGEWDALLDHAIIPQFRGVSVIGVTDLWNADDADIGAGHVNRIDDEVMYQLDEVFNPWDLRQAAHKETIRWVEFFRGDVEVNGIRTDFALSNVPVVVDSFWDYSGFPEKVLVNGVLQHRNETQTPEEALIGMHREYDLIVNATTGVGTIRFFNPPPKGAVIKVLYSTREAVAPPGGFVQLGLTLDSSGSIGSANWKTIVDGVAAAVRNNLPHDGTVELTVVQYASGAGLQVSPTVITQANFESVASTIEGIAYTGGSTAMAAGLNLTWFSMKNSPNVAKATKQIINLATDGKPNVALSPSPTGNAANDVTWVRDQAVIDPPYLDELDAEAIGTGPNVNWMRDNVTWPQPGTIAPPFNPGWVQQVADAKAFAEAIGTKFEIVIPPPRGRYEWAIVGRDSAAVDSAGAAMVTAAIKNKGLEFGLSGLDMKDNKFGPRIPYVHRFWTGTGTARESYYDKLGRTALKDDYCTTWPVASSNMITVGGPAANLASEYWNDFTDIFMTGPPFTDLYPYGLYALSSWDYHFQPGVSPGGDEGMGIVSTYKDLNGTVGFIAWGWTGDDTYFITKWLHEPYTDPKTGKEYPSGLVYLQDMNPCATSIKLEITYKDYHPPKVSVVRILGTISEKPQHPDP